MFGTLAALADTTPVAIDKEAVVRTVRGLFRPTRCHRDPPSLGQLQETTELA